MTVLVTGGTGYIGSHVVRLLRERGKQVVVVDDVVTGDRRRIGDVPLVRMDMASDGAQEQLVVAFRDFGVRSVVHFAGRKQVAESIRRPAWYYQQNLGSLANLLLAMEAVQLRKLVFSSSAAVYGQSEGGLLRESAETKPINPYGETKLVGEQLISDVVNSTGMSAVSLRYFNVAGAGWTELGDTAVLNLVPMVFERLRNGLPPLIFGDDYPTSDGTCVRDYIHVSDLANAHLAALDSLDEGVGNHAVYNVGTGHGSSVRQMVEEIRKASGIHITPEVLPRRFGDPAVVVSDPALIERDLGWRARLDLTAIVRSAWDAYSLLNRS